MGVDLSKWGWTEWIGMPVDLRRRRFGLVFSLRNFKNICRQVGVSLSYIFNVLMSTDDLVLPKKRMLQSTSDVSV